MIIQLFFQKFLNYILFYSFYFVCQPNLFFSDNLNFSTSAVQKQIIFFFQRCHYFFKKQERCSLFCETNSLPFAILLKPSIVNFQRNREKKRKEKGKRLKIIMNNDNLRNIKSCEELTDTCFFPSAQTTLIGE